MQATDLVAEIEVLPQQGRPTAEDRLRQLRPDWLTDPKAKQTVATLWQRLGLLKLMKIAGPHSALSAFQQPWELNPADPTTALTLVRAYWQLKDPRLTAGFLERVIHLVPANPLPHVILADPLYDRDDVNGAAVHPEQASRQTIEDGDVR